MKRITYAVFIFVLILSLSIPCYATSNISNVTDGENIIYLEYADFINNQQYYFNLVKEYGYALDVHVGKENIELEKERIAQTATSSLKLVPSSQTRGTVTPTDIHNIHSGIFRFGGYNYTSTLYFEKKVSGCEAYMVSVLNEYESNTTITCNVHGNSTGPSSFTVEPSHTVIQYIGTGNKSAAFYMSFPPPCRVDGYVNCIGH